MEQILLEGQENGDFGKFSVPVMAKLIQGAIGEYMMVNPSDDMKKVDLETYSEELVAIIKKATAPGTDEQ